MLTRSRTKKATQQSKILVVDDQPESILAIQEMLEDCDWQVITAANGEEAVQKATDERPHLILLDPMTQAMNGYKTLKCLKKNPALKDIPMVMCTGESGQSAEGPQDPLNKRALMIIKGSSSGSCNVISHRLLLTLAALVEQQDCILV